MLELNDNLDEATRSHSLCMIVLQYILDKSCGTRSAPPRTGVSANRAVAGQRLSADDALFARPLSLLLPIVEATTSPSTSHAATTPKAVSRPDDWTAAADAAAPRPTAASPKARPEATVATTATQVSTTPRFSGSRTTTVATARTAMGKSGGTTAASVRRVAAVAAAAVATASASVHAVAVAAGAASATAGNPPAAPSPQPPSPPTPPRPPQRRRHGRPS